MLHPSQRSFMPKQECFYGKKEGMISATATPQLITDLLLQYSKSQRRKQIFVGVMRASGHSQLVSLCKGYTRGCHPKLQQLGRVGKLTRRTFLMERSGIILRYVGSLAWAATLSSRGSNSG